MTCSSSRLLCPSDFPGKNTGVGCHFLLQRDLPDPRIKATFPVSPALQADSLPPSVDVQSLSCVQLFATLWTVACQTPVSFTISWSLLKLMSSESVMPSSHLILCYILLLLPSILPNIRVYSNELVLSIKWPKYWSFSFSISPSNEYSGLISFRMDWLHLLEVQENFKSLLQHHSSKASILQCSAFFIVQLSHPYMSTGKTITLTRWNFVDNFSAFK